MGAVAMPARCSLAKHFPPGPRPLLLREVELPATGERARQPTARTEHVLTPQEAQIVRLASQGQSADPVSNTARIWWPAAMTEWRYFL
jgi:hypothetical protein